MHFVAIALLLLSRTVASTITHPEAALELNGATRPYALCLDVVCACDEDEHKPSSRTLLDNII